MTKRKILPLPEIELHSSTQSAVSHFTDLWLFQKFDYQVFIRSDFGIVFSQAEVDVLCHFQG
jgi:hypothetical protein